jgi:xanthine dehydrogenase iron-sulfur cluster and FAD-binding subunit A
MTLNEIIEQLELIPLTRPQDYAALSPGAGYTSDLLSCVMAGAAHKGLWVTLQAHTNIVAVAALLDLCAVIITEGALPDAATIQKANEEGVILLSTQRPSFHVVGKLWELGLRAE